MEGFFSTQPCVLGLSPASRPSPAGSLRSALTPDSVPELGAATRKTSCPKPGESGWNQESSRSACEKENPRPGYEVCASITLASRLKAAPDGSIVMRKPAYIR